GHSVQPAAHEARYCYPAISARFLGPLREYELAVRPSAINPAQRIAARVFSDIRVPSDFRCSFFEDAMVGNVILSPEWSVKPCSRVYEHVQCFACECRGNQAKEH